MKLKLYDIVTAEGAIQELGKLKLPAKLGYKVAKNIRHINSELAEYNKMKNSLILEKYGVSDEKGNYQVTKENVPGFVKEVNELLETEVEIEIAPIELDDSILLSVENISVLSWLFLEQETPVENK